MRPFATILIVACSIVALAGCGGRGRRHWCPFGNRFQRNACVDNQKWDRCDDGDFDDDDDYSDCCPCDCHGGHAMPQYSPPMQSFDSGCGCGSPMPTCFDGGMSMSYPQFNGMPASSGCSSCGNGGMISGPSYPTFNQPMMMNMPMSPPTPTPTPATPPVAPAAEYYSPKGSGAPSSALKTVPPPY